MDEELQRMLAPLPATVPGKKKTSNPSKGDTSLLAAAEEPDEQQQSSPASFTKHKAVLAAKLNSVGNKVKPTPAAVRAASESPSVGGLSTASPDRVLVIPINDSPSELPGLASEESIVSASRSKMSFVGFDEAVSYREETLTVSSGEVLEKRTRFSLSHDEGSIGNTSDNLEAISEAASNHSVASSLEDEVDQVEDPIIDNLSDMVSANVSGRGTPNVSGRDTPSSQITEGDEPGQAEPAEPPVAPMAGLIDHVPPDNGNMLNRKNGEPDMEERFGRFEIKPEMRRGRTGQMGSIGGGVGERDEAVSMVSDTWSTDVIGSDTETVGEPPTLEDLLRGRPGDDFHARGRLSDQLAVPGDGLAAVGGVNRGITGGVSGVQHMDGETGSEWSMDVLASDSESFRLRDFDLEDSLSVSRSDDTRFTDDIAVSEPDQRLELNYYEDGTLTRSEGGVVRGLFPVKNASVEEWAELSRARNSEQSGAGDARRDSDASAHSATARHDSILKKPSAHVSALVVDPTLIELVESTPVDGTDGDDGGAGSLDSFPLGPIDNISNFSTARLSTTSIGSSASSHCSAASVEVMLQQGKTVPGTVAVTGLVANGSIPAEVEARPIPLVAQTIASTGAIPKSISFDKTADKDEECEHKQLALSKRDRNFFKNWKLPKIGRSRGGGRGAKGEDHHRTPERLLIHDSFHIPEHGEGPVRRDDSRHNETSDDILAKYRKAPKTELPQSRIQVVKPLEDEVDAGGDRSDLDLENPEKSFIFQDAKRKLRLMLSEVKLFLF